MMFRLTPKMYMKANVVMKESGIEMLTMPALTGEPRNSSRTAAASSMAWMALVTSEVVEERTKSSWL